LRKIEKVTEVVKNSKKQAIKNGKENNESAAVDYFSGIFRRAGDAAVR
jgi:hypothetical protein